jgi:putative ABC transport system permease protein
VRALDRNLPLAHVNTMEQLVARVLAQRRFALRLFGLFALLAPALAAGGIYGVVSYGVAEASSATRSRMAWRQTRARNCSYRTRKFRTPS